MSGKLEKIEVNYRNKKRYRTDYVPIKQPRFFTWLIMVLCNILLIGKKVKIEKRGMDQLKGKNFFALSNHMEFIDFIIKEIGKAENRETNVGFYKGITDVSGQLYDNRDEIPTQEYVGMILEYNDETKEALVEQRNYLVVGDKVEFFGPELANTTLVIDRMIDFETKEEMEIARHPLQKFWVHVPFKVSKYDLIRKVQ